MIILPPGAAETKGIKIKNKDFNCIPKEIKNFPNKKD